METIVLLFTVLLVISVAIVAMAIISIRKRRRRVEEDERHCEAEQDAKQRAEEKERQQLKEERRKAEEERKRLEEEIQQKEKVEKQKRLADELRKVEEESKRIEEEAQRKVQEKQRQKAEKETKEESEEELRRVEVERRQDEEERRKDKEEHRKAEDKHKHAEKESQQKKEKAHGIERRPPLERGGRPRGPIEQSQIEQPLETKPRSLKPEVVCWNEGWRWIVGIEVPEELETLRVTQNDELLEQDNVDESRYRLKHLEGAAKATWTGGEKDIPLVEAGRNYFIFKMRKDWKGLGRLVRHPTTGYYLAIIPQEWKRNKEVSGPAPIAPENVQIQEYTVNFFYLEQNTVISFITANGERIPVEPVGSRFQIVGREIDDASEEMGPLFSELQPCIKVLDEKRWSDIGVIVMGEEGGSTNKWRTQFFPQVDYKEQKLPEEIANRRGGWYFVRIYDNNDNLLESMDFRFLCGLKDICIESSNILPGPNGHSNVIVQFLHQTDCKVKLSDKAIQHSLEIRRESDKTIVTIPPKPDYDKIRWILCEGYAAVEVTVLVERIWWAFGVIGVTPNHWVDKSIPLSRKDFTATTDKALWVRLPRQRFVRKIDVGFEHTESWSYQVEVDKKEIAIPLRDFCDAEEIQNPTQESLFQLFIDSKDKTHSAALLQIYVSFRCKHCQFITNSEQEALSHMAVHLYDLILHLSYEELYQRFSESLPPKIYKCGYCNFYVSSGGPENPTSTIISHEEHDCPKAKREFGRGKIRFSIVSDVNEIRKNFIVNLPHTYQCQICSREFQGDDRESRLSHLQEDHKDEIFEIF